jgi:2-methylisocitrate lyase-like PEP mutase family enzyme
MNSPNGAELAGRCEQLRSLHTPGDPLLLPNAWDVATAQAVVAAGFPVVATTSAGVARALGYDDHEDAPAGEMLAAAWRIARTVDAPVTVDAEAGYDLSPTDLVAALHDAEAAGCNLEETDHSTGARRDARERAAWLSEVREAASAADYPLVINARVDLFLGGFVTGADPATQIELVPEALERANAYLDAGADCVYPIALWEPDAIEQFVAAVDGPVNVTRVPQSPPVADLAGLGVARVSWALFLFRQSMAYFEAQLASLRG